MVNGYKNLNALHTASQIARKNMLGSIITALVLCVSAPYTTTVIAAEKSYQSPVTHEDKGLLTNALRSDMPIGLYKASKLIGINVKDAKGDSIGEIVDLALVPSQRQVSYAVLSFGGVMGVGNKLFAIPLSAFETGKDRNDIVLNVTEDRLKSLKGFDDDKWPTDIADNWTKSEENAMQGKVSSAASRNIIKATDYMDYEVKNPQDKGLGEIEDLAIELKSGIIKYAVIEHGGLLGIGEKLVAVPASSLAPGMDKDEVIFNTTEAELKNARGFNEDNWPIAANSISDLEYATDKQSKSAKMPGFSELDGDNNGYVTKLETSQLPELQQQYDALDKNSDGKLDSAEFAIFEQHN